MIKTLSPYYLTIPLIGCISYTVRLYVWDGVKATPPSESSYTITKNNPTNSYGNDKLNVARLLNDYIDFMPSTGTATSLIDGDNQRWVKFTLSYTSYLGVTEEDDISTELVLKGYSYGMDGENAQPKSSRLLLDGNEFKVNRTGVFNVPIKILEV